MRYMMICKQSQQEKERCWVSRECHFVVSVLERQIMHINGLS